MSDDGFGPVQRGGGEAPRGVDLNPKPRPRSRPDAYEQHGPDDGFGPAQGGKSRRITPPRTGFRRLRLGRAFRILLLIVLIAVLALVGMGLAAGLSANSKIEREKVEGLSPVAGQRNILLIGSDSRDDLTPKQRRRLGTGNSFEGTRTDTVLLLSIAGSKAAMLSFPRDLYVQRCDGSSGRINAAYGLGGPSCLVKTVKDLSGIPVTHFMEVNFLGFHDIVEAVGGVRICLDEPISDRDAHIDLPAGCQRLNGREALGFVRVRKIDDDLGRIGRQQRFMKLLAKQMAQPATLLNPPRLFSTANAVGRAITADEGLGLIDLAALARAGASLGGSDFPTLAVPGAPTFIGGASVIDMDEAAAEPIFESFRDGSVLQQESTTLRPEDVSLEVHNGAGVPGLAQTAADALTEQGFTVTRVDNAEERGTSVVHYTNGNRAEAEVVAAKLPRPVPVEEVADGPGVVLILGRDAAP